jgi:hypothetical protein
VVEAVGFAAGLVVLIIWHLVEGCKVIGGIRTKKQGSRTQSITQASTRVF